MPVMALTTAVGEEMHTLFENIRSQVQSQLEDKPEPTIDEINAMIADVRRKRRS